MAPVDVPAIKAGDDARSALGRHRAALVEANRHLTCSRRWYDGVRESYTEQPGE